MPRAADGTVSLPVGNPVVSGTAISPTVHNATMADLAAMIQDSLSRSGQGGMQVPLTFQTGTAAAPGIAFDGDPNTGVYDKAADTPAISAGGVEAQEWSATGTTIPGTLTVTGAVTVPGAQFTRPNLPAVGQQKSSSSGAFSVASTTPVDVTNLTVTITTTGRPVMLAVIADGTASVADFQVFDGSNPNCYLVCRIIRGVTTIAVAGIVEQNAASATPMRVPPSWWHLDVVVAGTYTYKVQAQISNPPSPAFGYINNCVLVAFEL